VLRWTLANRKRVPEAISLDATEQRVGDVRPRHWQTKFKITSRFQRLAVMRPPDAHDRLGASELDASKVEEDPENASVFQVIRFCSIGSTVGGGNGTRVHCEARSGSGTRQPHKVTPSGLGNIVVLLLISEAGEA
jgi:hypothetical protein